MTDNDDKNGSNNDGDTHKLPINERLKPLNSESQLEKRIFLTGESIVSNESNKDDRDEISLGRSFLSSIEDNAERKDEEIVIGKRKLYFLRISMILVLLLIAAVKMAAIYAFMHKSENETFRVKFVSASLHLKEECQRNIDLNLYSSYTLAFTYLSLNPDVRKWPNVTLVNLGSYAESLCAATDCRELAFAPIVYNNTRFSNRLAWEQYATDHAHLLGSPSLVYRTDNTSWVIDDGIFQFVNGTRIYDPGYDPTSSFPDIMTPLWQVYPIEGNEGAVMLNPKPYSPRTFEDLLTYRIPVLTPTMQLVQDTEPRPSSVLYFPILNHFPISQANESNVFLGFISFAFSWDVVLGKALSKDTNGLICVLRASTGEVTTFAVDGGKAYFVGYGDLHDPKYDSLDYVPDVYNVSLGANWDQLAVVDNLVTFSINMYPSDTFKNKYVTNKPKKVLAGVLMVFVFTAAMFLIYDILLHRRLEALKHSVARSNTVVNSLFPNVVRDRLYEMNTQKKVKKSKAAIPSILNESAAHKISNFIAPFTSDNSADKDNQSMKIDSEPIADEFPSTTIMFADIAGFTSWSSAHTPQHVFRLLETLFKEFDRASKKLGVFKVETIGDCYVAVCGLPDPRDDHAVVMSQFALECQRKFNQVVISLEDIDANVLRLRSGLHSGPITAGILRGEKSRFQLFGDTMNIAAQMESSGLPTKVQISEETAELLRNADKGSWFTSRDDLITLKGEENAVQTYWLIPNIHIKDMLTNSGQVKAEMKKSVTFS